jgi:hypothetical protein
MEDLRIIRVEDLIDCMIERPLAVFLGSGVSIWEPTSLPTGKAFGSALFRALFLEGGKVNDPLGESQLEHLFSRIPFEIVVEQCPEPQILAALLTDTFNVDEYNPIHHRFAEALITGDISALVTTNYDCCMDKAMADILGGRVGTLIGPVRRVFQETDVAPRMAERLYFKIHGSADDPTRESLVFQLRHENVLPAWKRSLLRSIVEDRTLLLIGYSGLDFEICPEIPSLRPASVLWNVLTEEDITPNARMVLRKTDGALVVGDMRQLLFVGLRSVNATLGSPRFDIEALIRSRFSQQTLRFWRAKMLNHLSYGKSAMILIQELLKEPERALAVELLEEQARAFHYTGAYKRAALRYESIANLVRRTKLNDEVVYELLLSACDNWRCYGAFLRASRRLRDAEAFARRSGLTRPDLLASAQLKQILLLRRNYQIAEKLRASRYKNRLKRKAEELFRASAEALLRAGRRFEWQQLRLWADRFDLSPDVTHPAGMFELPPSREGYEHLAFPMAQMMVFRDEIDTGKRTLDKYAADEAVEKASLAENLGLRTEAWKLNYMMLRKFPSHRNFMTLRKFVINFAACEYSLLMRGLLLIIRP